ncbi:hypothetical protein QTG54_003456 [Skeletonema marinoi]|uniref:Fe2OG dioxygenase domain-containing protein n=1 Tax=Skeletonema marinoi TaxID=267567 RepID=A0AAD8YG76_9STRA|nr:hypothetical protein QTG54_003456 [Skeletonema marinoi]
MSFFSPTAAVAIIFIFLSLFASGEQYEDERVAEYHKRKHQWPPAPNEYVPNTPGWRSNHQRRFNQTALLEDTEEAYNAYLCLVHSALMSPNFTEFGWGLTKAPKSLVDALHENLMNGLRHAEDLLVEDAELFHDEEYDEEYEDSEDFEALYDRHVHVQKLKDENPLEFPLMIPNEQLNQRALEELLPIHEAWSGVKLKGNNAYGLRVYRNHSNLQMHIDETTTHIISSILHVGHDPDGEPWPLVIEDFEGNTHEVYLETGDMLLYESSKCFHGRPKRYNGKWYSSLFTHYYPVDWDGDELSWDAHYRIPPSWDDEPDDEGLDKLIITKTSFKEPGCEHEWCSMKNTTKSKSPEDLVFGQVVSTDGKIKSLGLDSEDEL